MVVGVGWDRWNLELETVIKFDEMENPPRIHQNYVLHMLLYVKYEHLNVKLYSS